MKNIENTILDNIAINTKFLSNESNIEEIKKIISVISEALKNKNRVYWCGNGGSAADAQHLSAELSGRFLIERDGLPSEALHCNTSYLTAVANDYGYEKVYSRLIKGMGKKGDVLIGISTSGNSPNILNAFLEANQIGIHTIGMTGENGGKFNNICQYLIKVPSNITARIQESHILIGHTICEQVENILFNGKN